MPWTPGAFRILYDVLPGSIELGEQGTSGSPSLFTGGVWAMRGSTGFV